MSDQDKAETFSDRFDASQNKDLSFMAEKDAKIAWLEAELERRTSERDYHMRMADKLVARIQELELKLAGDFC